MPESLRSADVEWVLWAGTIGFESSAMAPADAARCARERIEDLVAQVRSLEGGRIHRG